MTVSKQILKHAEEQYRVLMDKTVSKRKFAMMERKKQLLSELESI